MDNLSALESKPEVDEYYGELLSGHITEENLYLRFFGFRQNPFKENPDPRFFFLSKNHQECLHLISSGLNDRKGFISLLGESGTGKTILLNYLIKTVGERIKPVFVSSYPDLKLADLLRKIQPAQGFPLETMDRSGDHRSKIDRSLFAGITLILDEAQVLPGETLRRLCAFAGISNDGPMLQVIFAGHPDFDWNLSSAGLQLMRDSIQIQCRLRPLSTRESAEYIEHRLTLAGKSTSEVFTREGLSFLCKEAQGIPQRINRLCEEAFWLGFRRSQKRIDSSLVKKAAHPVHLTKRIYAESLSGPICLKKILYLSSVLVFFLLVFIIGRGEEASRSSSSGGPLSLRFGGKKLAKPASALNSETVRHPMWNFGDASPSLEAKSSRVAREFSTPFPPIPPQTVRNQELGKQPPPEGEKKPSLPPNRKNPTYPFSASPRSPGKKDVPALPKGTPSVKHPQIQIENTGARLVQNLGSLKTAGNISPTQLISGEKKDSRLKAAEGNRVQPIIIGAFASRTLDPGQTWKVYLKASAGKGDLKNIFTVVDRGNSYPAMTRITGANRKSLNGYIYLNTSPGEDFFMLNTLTLTVWIQDTAGVFSEPAVFPLSLERASITEPPPWGVFTERNLGPVMVQWNRYSSFGG